MILHTLQNLNNLVINTIQIKKADRVFTSPSATLLRVALLFVAARMDGHT